LENENLELARKAETANQGIRLVRYQIKEFVDQLDNYDRLVKEENDFLEFGSKIDRMMINDADILTRPEMEKIVINNIYSPTNENRNENKNHHHYAHE